MSKWILSLFLAAILFHPVLVAAGIEPDCESYGECAYSGPGTPVLFSVPDGGGKALTQAQGPGGNLVDATLTLYLRDVNYEPVAGYPAEDVWLEAADGGLVACPGGTIADAPSDQNGVTRWVAPLRAGGSSQALTRMVVNGAALCSSAGFELHHVTPDLNGDLAVNLKDVALFAQDYAAGYAFRSDLYGDQVVNISDIGRLATAVGAGCP